MCLDASKSLPDNAKLDLKAAGKIRLAFARICLLVDLPSPGGRQAIFSRLFWVSGRNLEGVGTVDAHIFPSPTYVLLFCGDLLITEQNMSTPLLLCILATFWSSLVSLIS